MAIVSPGYKITVEMLLGFREQGNGNRDGVGIMRPSNGTIVTVHTMETDPHKIAEIWQREQEAAYEEKMPIAVHFRKQTLGAIVLEMCHPFPVTLKAEGAKYDIWMMHNGTIPDVQKEVGKSDSYNFATYFIGPLLRKQPQLFKSSEFWVHASALLGLNKFIFMRDDGEVVVLNSRLGKQLSPGIWGSKKDDIKPYNFGSAVWEKSVSSPLALPPPQVPDPQKTGGSADTTDNSDEEDSIEIEQGYWVEEDGYKFFRVKEEEVNVPTPTFLELREMSESDLLEQMEEDPEGMAKAMYNLLLELEDANYTK